MRNRFEQLAHTRSNDVVGDLASELVRALEVADRP